MKLKIRYDNEYQILDLNENETNELAISHPVYGPWADDAQKEKVIQYVFNIMYNYPEYNSYHKYMRHAANDYNSYHTEMVMEKVKDKSVFFDSDQDDTSTEDYQYDIKNYQAVCNFLNKTFPNEPKLVDALICSCLNGMKISKYCADHGYDYDNLRAQVRRAKLKLAKIMLNLTELLQNFKGFTESDVRKAMQYLKDVI